MNGASASRWLLLRCCDGRVVERPFWTEADDSGACSILLCLTHSADGLEWCRFVVDWMLVGIMGMCDAVRREQPGDLAHWPYHRWRRNRVRIVVNFREDVAKAASLDRCLSMTVPLYNVSMMDITIEYEFGVLFLFRRR